MLRKEFCFKERISLYTLAEEGLTNGDNDRTVAAKGRQKTTLSDLIDKVSSLNMKQSVHKAFTTFSGRRDENATKFLEQFEPFYKEWSEKVFLKTIRNHLEGTALAWFRGAESILFHNATTFLDEFNQMFGIEESVKDQDLLKKLKNLKLNERRLTEDLMEIFELHRNSNIEMGSIIVFACENLPLRTQGQLRECQNWREVLFKARELDRESINENKRKFSKEARSQSSKQKENEIFRKTNENDKIFTAYL